MTDLRKCPACDLSHADGASHACSPAHAQVTFEGQVLQLLGAILEEAKKTREAVEEIASCVTPHGVLVNEWRDE